MTATGCIVIYVGDPMCSWCWGMALELEKFQAHCRERQVEFQIKVGGLRPGGGDPWDTKMKEFLRHHWDQVHEVSAQPFNYGLLELEEFNYDTTPACQLVVASRKWLGPGDLGFFAALQKRFYVDSKDLSIIENIRKICTQYAMDFQEFKLHFESEKVKKATEQDFSETRAWGVRGYPTVVLNDQGNLQALAHGYATFENLRDRLQQYLSRKTSV